MTSPVPEAESGGSQTLERGLAVLVLLGEHPEGLSTAEVAARTGLHRSIVHRLLVSLDRTGFATRDDSGRFRVGPSARTIVDGSRPSLRAVAEPVLHDLAVAIDATVSLVEVMGDAAVTTVVAEPPTHGPRFSYRLGNRDPLDRGAGGLAALAAGAPRPDEPPRVQQVRERGHVVTVAELNPGAVGIAAPVAGVGVRAAVNVVTADPVLAQTAVGPVVEAARRIAAALA
ncbi:MAG: helix-turn-helix domain-containing protein [Aeromicrobium erythreum]